MVTTKVSRLMTEMVIGVSAVALLVNQTSLRSGTQTPPLMAKGVAYCAVRTTLGLEPRISRKAAEKETKGVVLAVAKRLFSDALEVRVSRKLREALPW